MQNLIYMQATPCEGEIALPEQLFAPLAITVDIQIIIGHHMNNSLYSIFVNSNWLRIQAVDLDHITLHVMHLKEINRVLLSINASI